MYLKNNMLKAEEDKLAQKANTDFDNVTNAAKNACISWGMPDYENGEDKSLNVEYVAPCDGVLYGYATNSAGDGEARICISISKNNTQLVYLTNYSNSYHSGSEKSSTAYALIPAGYSYTFCDLLGTFRKAVFFPMKGASVQV